MGGRGIDHGLDLVPVTEVALDHQDLAAQILHESRRLFGGLLVTVHHGDPGRVLPGHLAGDATAETLSGAGDNRDLPVEHSCLLRLVPLPGWCAPTNLGSLPRPRGPLRSRG